MKQGTTPSDDVRLIAWCHGTVQGVGFRWWVAGQAKELNLAGAATNYPDGRVLVTAEGERTAAEELLRRLQPGAQGLQPQRPGHVTTTVEVWGTPRGLTGFQRR